MFKGFVIGVLATLGIGVVVAYGIVTSGAFPANADGEPLPLEVWAASTSLNATLAREAPKDANPVALTDENLIAGVKLYGENCAFCHGDPKARRRRRRSPKGNSRPRRDSPQTGSRMTR